MTNDTRSPEEIERDIERERQGLSRTLDELQHRFSLDGLTHQLSQGLRDHAGDIGQSVSARRLLDESMGCLRWGRIF